MMNRYVILQRSHQVVAARFVSNRGRQPPKDPLKIHSTIPHSISKYSLYFCIRKFFDVSSKLFYYNRAQNSCAMRTRKELRFFRLLSSQEFCLILDPSLPYRCALRVTACSACRVPEAPLHRPAPILQFSI